MRYLLHCVAFLRGFASPSLHASSRANQSPSSAISTPRRAIRGDDGFPAVIGRKLEMLIARRLIGGSPKRYGKSGHYVEGLSPGLFGLTPSSIALAESYAKSPVPKRWQSAPSPLHRPALPPAAVTSALRRPQRARLSVVGSRRRGGCAGLPPHGDADAVWKTSPNESAPCRRPHAPLHEPKLKTSSNGPGGNGSEVVCGRAGLAKPVMAVGDEPEIMVHKAAPEPAYFALPDCAQWCHQSCWVKRVQISPYQ